jgi:putative Ca2+/H+ antiporter (TMEM165/GDT1 family)
MIAVQNVWIVTAGTVLGHLTCTFAAVMGGRWLATKISVKHVTLGGALLFLIFGIAYLYEVSVLCCSASRDLFS